MRHLIGASLAAVTLLAISTASAQTAGEKIGQVSFVQLSEPAEKPYGSGGLGSKYQGQKGPTPSRYWKNFEP